MSENESGFVKFLPKEIKDRSENRLTICKTCDKFNHENKRCNQCGCFMEYKTLLPNAKCPIGKW